MVAIPPASSGRSSGSFCTVPAFCINGCGMKSCSDAKPAITGSSAAGICRIAGVGDVVRAIDCVVVDLDVKGVANLTRSAGHIDYHPARIHRVYGEAMRPEAIR